MVLALAISALAQGPPYPNPKFCDFFDSASTYNGQLAPVGSIIKAYDPRGLLVGVDTFGMAPTAPAGHYGFMPVYGDDPNTPAFSEGALPGDTIHFTINGQAASVVSGDPTWADQVEKDLRLSASATVAISLLRAPHDTLVTFNRVIRFSVVVRNDGTGIDYYALHATNGNTDFTTVDTSAFIYANPGDSAVLTFDIHTPTFTADTLDVVSFKVFSQLDTTKSVTGSVSLYMSITGVNDHNRSVLPNGFALNQNYPNPFNPSTTISFSLPRSSDARLEIFDLLGRTVESRDLGTLSAGDHALSFDASRLASGVYFYRVSSESGSLSRKMVLLK